MVPAKTGTRRMRIVISNNSGCYRTGFQPFQNAACPLDPKGLRPKYSVTVSPGSLLCSSITHEMVRRAVLKVSNHELRSRCQPRASLEMSQPGEDYAMKWKTPRIVEIAVGMEINCYACAEI